MQNVTVPYGEGSLTFPVDDGIEITRLELNDYPPLKDFSAELERVLNHPTGSAPLREKVHTGDKVAIIISDFTRASYRTDAYLARLLDECNAGGVPDGDITVVVATGYHEDATEEEKRHPRGRRGRVPRKNSLAQLPRGRPGPPGQNAARQRGVYKPHRGRGGQGRAHGRHLLPRFRRLRRRAQEHRPWRGGLLHHRAEPPELLQQDVKYEIDPTATAAYSSTTPSAKRCSR